MVDVLWNYAEYEVSYFIPSLPEMVEAGEDAEKTKRLTDLQI